MTLVAVVMPELRELESFTGATVLVDAQGGSLETRMPILSLLMWRI